jgi:hypothetical protein
MNSKCGTNLRFSGKIMQNGLLSEKFFEKVNFPITMNKFFKIYFSYNYNFLEIIILKYK